MARQFQIPGSGYINAEEDDREYQLPGIGYFNAEPAPAAGYVSRMWHVFMAPMRPDDGSK